MEKRPIFSHFPNLLSFKIVEVNNIEAYELEKKLKEGYKTEEGNILCQGRSKEMLIIQKDDCRS